MEKHAIRIAAVANKTLLAHSDGVFPVSPLKIAKSMGIQVVDKKHARPLLDLFDAGLTREPVFSMRHGNDFVIVMDRNHGNLYWRRAWLAHEIGHYLLDDLTGGEETRTPRLFRGTFRRSVLEFSCDLFALSLLMPLGVLGMAGITRMAEIQRICKVDIGMAFFAARAIRHRWFEYDEHERAAFRKFSGYLDMYRRQNDFLFLRDTYRSPLFSDISAEFVY